LFPKYTDVPHLRIGNAANARPNLLLDLADPIFHLQLRSVKVLGSQNISGERGDVSVLVVFFHLFLLFRLFFSGVSSETAWEA
jgi:hypothetical protein